MLLNSQFIPPSPSPTLSTSLFSMSASPVFKSRLTKNLKGSPLRTTLSLGRMDNFLDQALRFRLLKGPRSSAPHSPACKPRPALPRPTRSPHSSSVLTASRAGVVVERKWRMWVAGGGVGALRDWAREWSGACARKDNAMSIEIESSEWVSWCRMFAKWPDRESMSWGVEAARGRRPRGWGVEGYLLPHKEASGAGPQERSERKAQSPVEGGAGLGVGRACKILSSSPRRLLMRPETEQLAIQLGLRSHLHKGAALLAFPLPAPIEHGGLFPSLCLHGPLVSSA